MQQELKEKIEQVRAILPERFVHRVPLALVHSFGCQQNVSDGEKLKGLLAEMGFGLTDDLAAADMVLYNTCAVREHAEDRVFGNVGALKKKKSDDPATILGVCGCMMQREEVAEKMKKSYPYVDLIFGTNMMGQLPDLLCDLISNGRKALRLNGENTGVEEGLPVSRPKGAEASLPIMVGCNNFCTYCIVPYVRGRERSREKDEIIAEFEDLIALGYKEITILGQNVNSYGRGLEKPCTFPELLQELASLPGDFIIRFMTSHPKDASKELFDVMAQSKKIEKHLHLPVQSGSDRVLAAMNRGYTAAHYRELIAYAKSVMPDLTLSTDIITGFPGETEAEACETLRLVRDLRYDMVYSFIYSKRSGTRAAEMPDPVPHEKKVALQRELLESIRTISEENNKARIGKTLRVLVTGEGRKGENTLSGKTSGALITEGEGDRSLIGTFCTFTVTGAKSWCLTGNFNIE